MLKTYNKNPYSDFPDLEFLLNEIYDAVIIADKNEKIIFYNKNLKNIINIKNKNIIGTQYHKIFKDYSEIKNFIEEKDKIEKEIMIDGKYILLKKFLYKSKNNNTYYILILKDVTLQEDSKHQLEKLKESLEMIEELLDNAYYGMTIVDENGKIVKWNYEKFMGIKEEDVLGKYVYEVIDNTRLHIIAKTGKKELCQIQKIQGNHVITSRIPIIKNGKIIGAAGTIIFKNLDEVKSLAQKLKLLEDTLHKYKGEISRMYSAKYSFDDIITQDEKMMSVIKIAKKAANTNSTILIQGESGTGKELFAHAIHNASPRNHKSFVTINCAAIPRELLESELFGYENGAFTGAKKSGKIGKFELANGGTILLDEIDSMPLDMQAKLLRVLESKEFERLGSNNRINLDVRIIASTNENLEEAIEKGKFRRDLYYRLNVIKIEILPLRKRINDIPLLIQHFITNLSKELNIKPKTISDEAIKILTMHKWLGNVRELRNVIERTLSLTTSDIIEPKHLPEYLLKNMQLESKKKKNNLSLKEIIAKTEIEIIKKTLKDCNGNKSLAAKKLGIHRTALYKKIKNYNLDL
ncbi:PAS domain S-box-containing protein [Caminicella sporogenes DSM 14501]|uniref:PAS domain S-box-containing protein n=1 Tax=Caminicella sporogenes DSM 14501 TaxID=1121266 RepID=A0A1M6RJF7_9FIRM|nr:sigma 54-interacting transcriptional regulator [Caminicella sporogenes]RKD25254.1 sigma-54-dependent Fis family transcriptional regulator [Caminicella sporogenes]SHK32508.1 PAS domain S-box-containing protein [Caminicella sporogenes DSM 14501]